MNITRYGAGIFTLTDFLTPTECQMFIHSSENTGYEEAEIQTLKGSKRLIHVRNNDRIIFDDPLLAEKLFLKAQKYLPAIHQEMRLIGLNERFRFYRYGAEQYFKWHQDGSFVRPNQERSALTFLMYLNDDFVGGETQLQWDTIMPKTGMLLVFPHRVMHQGATILSGTKYVLRTDVMYQPFEI